MILFSGLVGISCIPVFIGFLIKFKSELRVIHRVSWKAALNSETQSSGSISSEFFPGRGVISLPWVGLSAWLCFTGRYCCCCLCCAAFMVGVLWGLHKCPLTHPPHRLASLP